MKNGGHPFAGMATVSNELKRRILEYDDKLELHQIDNFVHMYRVSKKRSGNDDVLVHQFVLKYPPGDWIMDCLHKCDVWKTSLTPEIAAKKQLKIYKNPGEVEYEIARAKFKDAIESTAKDLDDKVLRGKCVI